MTSIFPKAIRQTVKIVSMENRHYLRTGDRCSVEFEFVSHPEFIRTDMKLLFREGKTKVRSFVRLFELIIIQLQLLLSRRELVQSNDWFRTTKSQLSPCLARLNMYHDSHIHCQLLYYSPDLYHYIKTPRLYHNM